MAPLGLISLLPPHSSDSKVNGTIGFNITLTTSLLQFQCQWHRWVGYHPFPLAPPIPKSMALLFLISPLSPRSYNSRVNGTIGFDITLTPPHYSNSKVNGIIGFDINLTPLLLQLQSQWHLGFDITVTPLLLQFLSEWQHWS